MARCTGGCVVRGRWPGRVAVMMKMTRFKAHGCHVYGAECFLLEFDRCQALCKRVDQLYSSKFHGSFISRCSDKPVPGSSDWFKVRIGRTFRIIFMSTSCLWHGITIAVLVGAHLARIHSLTRSMSFLMRVSQTGSAVRFASFLDLALNRSQHWPRLRSIERLRLGSN